MSFQDSDHRSDDAGPNENVWSKVVDRYLMLLKDNLQSMTPEQVKTWVRDLLNDMDLLVDEGKSYTFNRKGVLKDIEGNSFLIYCEYVNDIVKAITRISLVESSEATEKLTTFMFMLWEQTRKFPERSEEIRQIAQEGAVLFLERIQHLRKFRQRSEEIPQTVQEGDVLIFVPEGSEEVVRQIIQDGAVLFRIPEKSQEVRQMIQEGAVLLLIPEKSKEIRVQDGIVRSIRRVFQYIRRTERRCRMIGISTLVIAASVSIGYWLK